MTSYNEVNGVYAHENKHLLQEILRDEWGFDGMVVSDWGGSNSAVAAVKAGGSLEMPSPGFTSVRELEGAVKAGTLVRGGHQQACRGSRQNRGGDQARRRRPRRSAVGRHREGAP